MAVTFDLYFGYATKDWNAGRNAVLRYLAPARDTGKPRLYVLDSAAPNLRREILNYSYKPEIRGIEAERPAKKNDHAMDTLRYLIIGIDQYMGWAI